jgi:hypothetical protein
MQHHHYNHTAAQEEAQKEGRHRLKTMVKTGGSQMVRKFQSPVEQEVPNAIYKLRLASNGVNMCAQQTSILSPRWLYTVQTHSP